MRASVVVGAGTASTPAPHLCTLSPGYLKESGQVRKAVTLSIPGGGREEDFSPLIPPQLWPGAALTVLSPAASTWVDPGLNWKLLSTEAVWCEGHIFHFLRRSGPLS